MTQPSEPDRSASPTGGATPDPTGDLAIYAVRLVRLLRRELDLPAGSRVLSILDAEGPQGITALARLDGCSQPTMSGQIAYLVERGLVSRTPHPEDARSSLITMTDQGRESLATTRAGVSRLLRERLVPTDHTAEELATTVALLRDLIEPQPAATAAETRTEKGNK
ncbi:MarR family winged helix-turn-helix transcriptional regulator [Nocardioides insulae]|uniref:MarR family winged helix-turn-helix transcriptional regulator n=1 Tax=Nocardioides insulae TaxID=394734 RepID=UPI001B7F9B54|nr:MarR family transcriptional regulator [Nocardioides insulae]